MLRNYIFQIYKNNNILFGIPTISNENKLFTTTVTSGKSPTVDNNGHINHPVNPISNPDYRLN